MIFAGVYFVLILFLIYRNRLFGIFNIDTVSSAKYTLLFVFKAMAVPVFYWIFQHHYGGIENFDAGKYYSDSKVINSIAFENSWEYIKLLLGFQDESPDHWLYKKFLIKTMNWDEGQSVRSILNDNKTVIRFHSVLHFISGNSYFVHALISCLMGYAGINWIVATFKRYLNGYEFAFLCFASLIPNLWLYTGGVLKEPLLMFNIGLSFKIIDTVFLSWHGNLRKVLLLIVLVPLALWIKPFVAVTVIAFYLVFKTLEIINIKRKELAYISAFVIVVLAANFAITQVTRKSPLERINTKQTQLYDLMKGGVFLIDSEKK